MPETIGLEAVLRLEQFQRNVDSFINSIDRMNDRTNSFAGQIAESFRDVGKVIAGTAAFLTVGVGTAAGLAAHKFEQFARKSVLEAAALQDQLAEIAAVMSTTIDAVDPLRDVIQELAIDPKLRVNTFQAAEAMELLAKNGLSMTTIMEGAARATIAMANATGGEFARSAAVVTDLLNIFNLEASHMEDVIDQVTAVVNQTKYDLDDYFLAVANGAAIADNAGLSMEDFNAALIAVAPAFNSGRRAGTGLGAALLNLVPKSRQAAQVMAALGMVTEEGFIKFFDAQGAFLGLENAAQVLQDTLGGLSEAERTFFIRQIFGVDAQEAVIRLMELGAEGIREIKEEMAKTDAVEAAATRMDTLAGAWEVFTGLLEAMRVNFGNRLVPGLQRGLKALNTTLEENFGQFDRLWDALARVLDKVIDALIPLIQQWLPRLGEISNRVADYIIEVVETGNWLNDSLGGLVKPIRVVIEYVQRAIRYYEDLWRTLRQVGFAIWEVLEPFVAWLRANVTFEDVLKFVTLALTAFIRPLIVAISQVGAFVTAVLTGIVLLRKAWESNWGGIREFAVEVVERVVRIIYTVIEIIETLVSRFGGDFGGGLEQAFIGLQPIVLGLLGVIQWVLDQLLLVAQGNWQQAWENVKDAVQGIIDEITRYAQQKIDSIDWGSVRQAALDVWEEIRTSAITLWDQIVSVASQKIKEWRDLAVETFNDFVQKASAKIDEWQEKIKALFAELIEKVKGKIEEWRGKIEEELKKIDWVAIFDTWYAAIDAEIKERTGKSVEEWVASIKSEVEKRINLLKDIGRAMFTAVFGDWFVDESAATSTLDKIKQKVEEVKTKFSEVRVELELFYQKLLESPIVQWVEENAKIVDFLAGIGGVLYGVYGIHIPQLLLKGGLFFAAFALGSMALRNAWETNWAGIRDFVDENWPKIQTIGEQLLELGLKIWESLGPGLEESVRFLLGKISELLTIFMSGLVNLNNFLETGDGSYILKWFNETLPGGVSASEASVDELIGAFSYFGEQMGIFFAYWTTGEGAQKIANFLNEEQFEDAISTLTGLLITLGDIAKILNHISRGEWSDAFEAFTISLHRGKVLSSKNLQFEKDLEESLKDIVVPVDVYAKAFEDAFAVAGPHVESFVDLSYELRGIPLNPFGPEDIYTRRFVESLIPLGEAVALGFYEIGEESVQSYIKGIAERENLPVEKATEFANRFIAKIAERSLELKKTMGAVGQEAGAALVTGTESGVSPLPGRLGAIGAQSATSLSDGLRSGSEGVYGESAKLGNSLVDEFVKGIEEKNPKLIEIATNIGTWFLDQLGIELGVKSPSTKTFAIAVDVVQGLLDGVESRADELGTKVSILAKGIITYFETILKKEVFLAIARDNVMGGTIEGIEERSDELGNKVEVLTGGVVTLFETILKKEVFLAIARDNVMGGTIEGIEERADELGNKVEVLTSGIITLFEMILTYAVFEEIANKNIMGGTIDGIENRADELGTKVNMLTKGVVTIFETVLKKDKFDTIGRAIVQGLIDGMTSKAQEINTVIQTLATTIKTQAETHMNKTTLVSVGQALVQGIIDGINSQATALQTAVQTLSSAASAAVSATSTTTPGVSTVSTTATIPGQTVALGSNASLSGIWGFDQSTGQYIDRGALIAQGLAAGIASQTGAVQTASQQIAQTALNTIATTTQTASPSRLTFQYGQWTAEGFILGFDDTFQKMQHIIRARTESVIHDLYRMAQAMRQVVAQPVPVTPFTAGRTYTTNTQVTAPIGPINVYNQIDEQRLINLIRQQINRAL